MLKEMNNSHGLPGLIMLLCTWVIGIINTLSPSTVLIYVQIAGGVSAFIYYLIKAFYFLKAKLKK